MKICPKCGTKGDVKFCPECGTEMIEEVTEVVTNEKVCPNCGFEGDVAFCPECGTKMIVRTQQEEKESIEPVENTDANSVEEAAPTDAVQETTEETAETEKQLLSEEPQDDIAITEGEIVPEAERSIPEADAESEEKKASGGWKFASAAGALKAKAEEDPEKKEQKRKKRKKILKIVGIIVGIIVLAFIALIVIGTALQDDLDHDMDNPKSSSINSLKYQYPDNWIVDDSDSGLSEDDYVEREKYVRWNKDDNSFMARMQIYYLGDDVNFNPEEYYTYLEGNETQDRSLTVGDTDIAIKEYDTELDDTSDESIKYDTTTYTASFEKDYSDFFVIIDAMSTVYDADFCDQIIQGIDVDNYKNPKTAKEIKAVYKGGNTPGTQITTGDENVIVTVEYTEGDDTVAEKWSMDKDITIEEGKTSEATISCHGLTCTLEVTGRKPVELTVKYNGKTKAGTKITKDDITVTVKYDDDTTEEVTDFEINKSPKLKAGETSTVEVTYGDLSDKLSVECTTLSKEQYKAKCVNRNYKNQLRNASYDEFIKIYGQVLQDCGYGYYRISSSGGYDDVYMVYAPDSDIVEDDWCTVYGKTDGIYEYETVMGANQKVPKINAKYVDR